MDQLSISSAIISSGDRVRDRGTDHSLRSTFDPNLIPSVAQSWQIVLHIGTEVITAVRIDLTDQLIIGRADPIKGYVPDLNLTPFGVRGMDISHRHAMLCADDSGLYVQDLSSTSGTWLNSHILQRDQAYKIHEGDVIKLGYLPVAVHAVRPLTRLIGRCQ